MISISRGNDVSLTHLGEGQRAFRSYPHFHHSLNYTELDYVVETDEGQIGLVGSVEEATIGH